MAGCTECDGSSIAEGDCYSEPIVSGCEHVMWATCKYWSVERSSADATGSFSEDAYVEVRCREYATLDCAECCSTEASDGLM